MNNLFQCIAIDIGSGSKIIQVALGVFHSCVVLDDGMLKR